MGRKMSDCGLRERLNEWVRKKGKRIASYDAWAREGDKCVCEWIYKRKTSNKGLDKP